MTARTAGTALQRGTVPPGTYAGGGRSPIVYAFLCPPCAGYAPTTDEDYSGFLSGRCQGCGTDSRELHRFQALILSAANGGCMCTTEHRQVTGDLPTEVVAMGVLIEVRTRPGGDAGPAAHAKGGTSWTAGAEAAAWGGRGPSASYAEWAAEGVEADE